MTKTYVFAGASSKMATETAALLIGQNHQVIGLSTKEGVKGYSQTFQVPSYSFGAFPALDTPIDGLVYFPGTIQLKPFLRLSETDFVNDYRINALGAVAFVQAYANQLKLSSSASIVFISSVAAGTGMPFHSSIAMAKGAIEALGKSLAAEMAPSIRVNTLAPSLTNTPLGEKFLNTPEKLDASQKRNPLKKVGEAKDMANLIEFLLSEKSGWMTGQTIAIDGGMNHLRLL